MSRRGVCFPDAGQADRVQRTASRLEAMTAAVEKPELRDPVYDAVCRAVQRELIFSMTW